LFGLAPIRAGSLQVASELHQYKLQGRVVNSTTSAPIGRALVEVLGRMHNAMLTDSEGRFEFSDLPAGSITLSVEKPGFVGTGAYRTLGRNQLVVKVGPEASFATLRLVPESTISGQVADQDGTPIEGAMVRLVRIDIVGGRKQWLRLPVNVSTDPSGVFRFAGLGSGSYYIVVSTSAVKMPLETDPLANARYPELLYFPGNPVSSSAAALDVAPGQEAHVDLALTRTPVFQVSGAWTGGTFARQLGMQILDPGGEVLPIHVHYDGTGKFQIDAISAGTYRVRAQMQVASGSLFVSEQFISVNAGVSNLRIPAEQPVSIPINVSSDFAEGALLQCNVKAEDHNSECARNLEQGVKVAVHSATPFRLDARSAFDTTQGPSQLKVTNVYSGEYSVSVRSTLGYVESARCGGVDLLREKLVVRTGVAMPPIEVVLRDDAASIGGSVRSQTPFDESFVLLVPEFAPLQPPVVVNTNSTGGFLQAGLAPGDYKILAFDAIRQLEYENPAVLAQYASKAAHITLSAKQNAKLSVDLIVTENE
jgi:carboxypeptidase family protein